MVDEWLHSFPNLGSPTHRVLDVGLLKRLVQLKELSSPLLAELDWKDHVCYSLQDYCVLSNHHRWEM